MQFDAQAFSHNSTLSPWFQFRTYGMTCLEDAYSPGTWLIQFWDSHMFDCGNKSYF